MSVFQATDTIYISADGFDKECNLGGTHNSLVSLNGYVFHCKYLFTHFIENLALFSASVTIAIDQLILNKIMDSGHEDKCFFARENQKVSF